MSKNKITSETLMRTLPSVLANDPKMSDLAQVIADALGGLAPKTELVSIYTNIDKLEEGLLDILARDFKVDWYDFNFSLETKRATIKDSVKVHRHMGTTGAVETALSAIYPGTEVLEWFEYGGRPYHFVVNLDVTNQREPVRLSQLHYALSIYKSLRSVMEENAFNMQTRLTIRIGVTSGYSGYSVRLCGTYPKTATQGAIADDGEIDVGYSSESSVYSTPVCGAMKFVL